MWATWWWAHVWLQVKCVSIPPPAQQMSEHGDCFQRKTCWEYRSGICLKPLAFPPLKEKTKQTSSILPSYSLSGTLMEIRLCRLTSDLTFCSLKWSSTLHLCSAWGRLVPPGESASLISSKITCSAPEIRMCSSGSCAILHLQSAPALTAAAALLYITAPRQILPT